MKVAFISRNTLFTGRGGDTIQVIKTAEYLEKLGVQVDIFTSASKIDYSKYDIIHGFNVIRPADLITHFENFDKIKILSTIYVNYEEYEINARGGLMGKVFKWIGNDRTEFLKTFMRKLKNGEKSFNVNYLLRGHKATLKRLLNLSDRLLPNSENEYRRLYNDYGISRSYRVIPNAIDPQIFKPSYDVLNKNQNLVLCVARIDGVKNQLNLIRALRDTEFELILIGKPGPNQNKYYGLCKEEATSNISFISEITQEELVAYYRRAKVHAMPSWFETTGLSSLEAAAMGCALVISDRGDTRDYFGNDAFYADPQDTAGIYKAVLDASLKPYDETLRNRVYSNFTWEKTAAATLEAYNMSK